MRLCGVPTMTTAPDASHLELGRSMSAGVRRFARSLSVTLIGQALVLSGLFVITRVSATTFGAEGFGEYQVARRTLAVVAFPLMCGLGVSMPRYIARDSGDKLGVARWLLAGIVLSVALVSIFSALGMWWSDELGQWAFGVGVRRWLVFTLLLAVAGTVGTTLALSVMRGLSRFRSAAVLQVVNGALVPLVGVLFASGRVDRALWIAGVLWIVIASAVFMRLCSEWRPSGVKAAQLYRTMRVLFIFGAPRVPGDVALFGLFALPVFAAVHRNNIVSAGFLSVGLSLVQSIATVFASTGFVLLPYWSRAATNSEALQIARRRMGMLVIASLVVATTGLVVLQLLLRPIARVLLGPLADAGMHDIRYVTFGAVPYVVYLVLRDYFDAISSFPTNTVALIVAIAIQATLLSGRWPSVPVATVSGFGVLGMSMAVLWAFSLRRPLPAGIRAS